MQVPSPVSASASAASSSSGSGLDSGLVSVSSSPPSEDHLAAAAVAVFNDLVSVVVLPPHAVSLTLTLPVLPSPQAVNVAACAYEVDFS